MGIILFSKIENCTLDEETFIQEPLVDNEKLSIKMRHILIKHPVYLQ